MPPKVEACVTSFMNNPRNKEKWPDEKERRSTAFAICNAAIMQDESDTRGYFIHLDNLGLAEGESQGWVHLLPYAEVEHPVYGDIVIDETKVNNFIKNFKSNVRGIMLDIDYSHKADPSKGQKAAGWIINLAKKADGLWGLVAWTGEALKEIKDGAWKYMSAEFKDLWVDARGKEHKDVLFGAALTNRPFMKDLAPVNFEELDLDDIEKPNIPQEFIDATQLDEDDPNWIDPVELMIKEFRDIPQSVRSGMPSSDFAGKGTSFPIQKCEDVRAAFHALGLTSQNRDQVRSRIISIAKRKGFTRCLPASVQADEFADELFARRLMDVVGR